MTRLIIIQVCLWLPTLLLLVGYYFGYKLLAGVSPVKDFKADLSSFTRMIVKFVRGLKWLN